MDLTDGRTEGFRIDNTSWRGQGSVEGVGDRILEDDKELVRKLDQIWISNTKLQVNIPKYSKRDNDFQREKAQSKQPTPNMQRSYADVLKGTRREVLPAKPHRSTWQQRTTKKQWTGLEFTVNKEDSAWLDGYYVGTTRSVELIPTMQEKLYMEGYFACTVKPMGGRLMLLSSEDKDELKDWWRMQQIGLASDDSTSRKLRFDIVRVLISTSSKDFISKSITIKVSGQFFNIVIKEEEASNGLFSMKSDHVIFSNSNSDGDDMVSWSICTVETRNKMENDELINCKDFEIPIEIGERDAVGPQQVAFVQKNEDVEARRALEDVESTNCVDFESLPNAGNDVRVAVGPFEIALVQDLSKNVRNRCEEQMTLAESSAQSNAKSWPTTCSGRNLEWGLKGESSKPNPNMDKTTQSPSKGRNLEIEPEENVTSIHRKLLCEKNAANNLERRFWEDIDSDFGEIKEWMRLHDGRTLKTTRKRRKKARSCAEIYQNSRAMQISKDKMKRRGRPSSGHSIPTFLPSKASIGRLGGLLCIWNSDIFCKETVLEGTNFLGVYGFWGENAVLVFIINIYSPCELASKRLLWEELSNLVSPSASGNWCILGDFNTIKGQHERKGCKSLSSEMREFCDFINELNLIDLPLIGRKYTWYKSNGESMSRLDRALFSENWLSSWPDMKQWCLARSCSDHCPILLKNQWRTRRNKINCIQVKGQQLTEVDEVKEGVASYFEDMFKDEGWERLTLDGIHFNKISQVESCMLSVKFTEEEIYKAVWDCDSSKTLGPDGFNFKFFKEMWEVIKQDIIGFADEFYTNGKLVKGSNASFVVLIPKTSNTQKIEDFRPISLIGSMYKIITKLLANRIRLVMGSVIGVQQTAFVKDKLLVDGVLVANEVIDEAKRRRKSSFVLKLDFEKAFDKSSSLPVFLMSFYLLPKGITHTLDKLIHKRVINWVKWEKVCKSKLEGGLGVRNLQLFNLALLGMWEGNDKGSLWWRDLCKLRELGGGTNEWLRRGFQLKVGEGALVRFWSATFNQPNGELDKWHLELESSMEKDAFAERKSSD
ncbi:hypothetical protein SLEP1_g53030 [Rubroshorea leprosula]|uniref:Reverse transcriptase domain-containing protein n=1 Tax=Rubroshorea leprosula TaxID=152421 RepID=A0AAV5M892_9ROSI|nr:hypothetical protein SLEP1_g53030 [Rubroshorea leprosula]